MASNTLLLFLLLCVHEGTMANQASIQEDAPCYRIEPVTLVCVVISDIVLTVAIVLITYFCASRRRRQTYNAEKVYMNVRANCKK
ncbi:hematopoietic cell signal transducer [Clupea harengus]|uniref:Hematopoietic cell signal transducer n=1 Tax=Clupea harengus TaxID=7950 RepID=A0A8M1KTM4_CLUHA|nr:hematopoietic cell signal transducer [Clupea harengus]